MIKHKQNGFTIVELMVTLVLNSLVLLAITQLFIQNRDTYETREYISRLQENGRFAMEYILRDIRYADFWGCVPDNSAITNNVHNAAGGASFASGGISGTNNTGPSYGGFPNGADTILITRASSQSGQLIKPMLLTSDVITVGFDPNVDEGDVLAISDCEAGDIFVVTKVEAFDRTPPVGDDEWEISHALTEATDGDNANTTIDLSRTYDPDKMASLHTSAAGVAYSIGLDGTEPALLRNGQVLVPGVETLQILYGEDTDGNGSVDAYVTSDLVTDDTNIVSVRVALVMRSEDEPDGKSTATPYTFPGVGTVTPTDLRARKVYSSTATIRNRVQTATMTP